MRACQYDNRYSVVCIFFIIIFLIFSSASSSRSHRSRSRSQSLWGEPWESKLPEWNVHDGNEEENPYEVQLHRVQSGLCGQPKSDSERFPVQPLPEMLHEMQILPKTRRTPREDEDFKMWLVSGQFHVFISAAVAQVDAHARPETFPVQHLQEVVHVQVLPETARVGAQSDHSVQVQGLRERLQQRGIL